MACFQHFQRERCTRLEIMEKVPTGNPHHGQTSPFRNRHDYEPLLGPLSRDGRYCYSRRPYTALAWVPGSGLRVSGFGFHVSLFGFPISGAHHEVAEREVTSSVPGSRFRISDLGCEGG